VQQLITDTWANYPNIQSETHILEIRFNGDWATVETLDRATATIESNSGIIDEPGELKSQSRGMIFLRRIGKPWEVPIANTIYERATILYGAAKGLKVTLSAPDQVFSGEPYTAKINVDLPEGALGKSFLGIGS
jgi:hypothetical protein